MGAGVAWFVEFNLSGGEAMSREEFYQSCAALYESLEQRCIDCNCNAHAKFLLPDGGHLYFEVKRGGRHG